MLHDKKGCPEPCFYYGGRDKEYKSSLTLTLAFSKIPASAPALTSSSVATIRDIGFGIPASTSEYIRTIDC